MNQILINRANAATAAIVNAKTSAQKYDARREGAAALGALEKQLGDQKALAAFSKEKPQSSFGVYKGEPVSDRPVFMTGPAGTRIVTAVLLPDGITRAEPNPQGQIVVPLKFVPAMIARGFIRANSVITELDTAQRDPAPPAI
jgi:hypothetical protein